MGKGTKKYVFIIGSKGIPANYGGFETFVEKLTEYKKTENLIYYVACLADNNDRFEHNGARCFNVKVPNIGPARAIYYDVAALARCIRFCENAAKKGKPIETPVFYVLACRIGPFIRYFQRRIQKLGGKLYINPDGHEWKRSKWSYPVRMYWKISEQLMVKHADLLICDSKNIESYIQTDYSKYHPNTTYLSYGAEFDPSTYSDEECGFTDWCKKHGITSGEYYVNVGRFVPENNYEAILREYMHADSNKDLVIITTENSKLSKELEEKLHFSENPRIKFVGTVYDQKLLKRIREKAFAYIHGHEVGGTNPSLLEALGLTELNLLLGVGFNREVGEDTALYWEKKDGSLAQLMKQAEQMSDEKIKELGKKAHKRIETAYSWGFITSEYEKLFMEN